MPNLVSSAFASHSNELNTIVPAAGSNRLFIVGHSIELSNDAVADVGLASVTFRGQSATQIGSAYRSDLGC